MQILCASSWVVLCGFSALCPMPGGEQLKRYARIYAKSHPQIMRNEAWRVPQSIKSHSEWSIGALVVAFGNHPVLGMQTHCVWGAPPEFLDLNFAQPGRFGDAILHPTGFGMVPQIMFFGIESNRLWKNEVQEGVSKTHEFCVTNSYE